MNLSDKEMERAFEGWLKGAAANHTKMERRAFEAAWNLQQARINKLEEALRQIPVKINEAGWNDMYGTCNAKNHTEVLCRIAREISEQALQETGENK